jgi:MOSC domain-containing protein YiiM
MTRRSSAIDTASVVLNLSVAEVGALLYLPRRSHKQLQRALRIPALSKSWQSSFQAMLQQDSSARVEMRRSLR